MTHNEYERLDEFGQVEVLFNQGIHIADRADDKYCMILFQIDDFYVELYYHLERDTLKKLRSFKHTRFIEPYLDQIDLSELLIEIM